MVLGTVDVPLFGQVNTNNPGQVGKKGLGWVVGTIIMLTILSLGFMGYRFVTGQFSGLTGVDVGDSPNIQLGA